MKNEENQALIEWCNWRIEKGRNTLLADASYDAAVVSLAALTAKPVKQPGTKCIGWVKETIHEHDAKWRDAIRAAGYEVQE